jgi:phytoene/squalene synthetase
MNAYNEFQFAFQVVSINDDVQNAVEAGEHLVDAGFSADTAMTREQTEGLIRQLNRLDERARHRESDLEAMLEKLQEFTKNHVAVMDDIVQVGYSAIFFALSPW